MAPQLFIIPSTIIFSEYIKLSEIIRVIIVNYGGQLVLNSVSSAKKFCVSKMADWIQNSLVPVELV